MAELIMEVEGYGKKVTLYADKVMIGPNKGMFGTIATGGGAEQTIRIKDITDIGFKKAGAIGNGQIQFNTASSKKSGAGLLGALEGEDMTNTVTFLKKHQSNFEELRDKVEEMVDSLEQQSSGSQSSSADELKKYGDLLKDGLISQEEFDQKKKEILEV